jgi:polar amino acid transport system permease protein
VRLPGRTPLSDFAFRRSQEVLLAITPPSQVDLSTQLADLGFESSEERLKRFPWWLVGLVLVSTIFAIIIITRPNFHEAFLFIIGGISIEADGSVSVSGILLTIFIAVVAFLVAVIIGLFAGLGRVSGNIILNNLATFYVEFIRGIPMLVLIFFIALVGVPGAAGAVRDLGISLANAGVPNPLTDVQNDVPILARAIVALSTTYGAFLAEIFRAGIQSISPGQMEAARSLGMTYGQSMRYVILPQAVRNILPALGNDFISMLKDSSLVSVLAVREITQIARLYAGRSFRFPEAYTTLSIMYLTMTVILSLLLRVLERRMRSHA